MSRENKHLKRNLLLIGLGISLLIPIVIAECDTGIFPSTPVKSFGELFKSSWCNIFMVTPFLEDMKNCWGWTAVGDGTLYDGSGFDRYDACKFSCDAKKKCDALRDPVDCYSSFREGLSSWCGGSGTDECSHCIDNHCEADPTDCTVVKDTCTELSGMQVLGYVIGGEEDCFEVCKVKSKYILQTDPVPVVWDMGIPYCPPPHGCAHGGPKSFHGIPYKLVWFKGERYCCPERSHIEEVEIYDDYPHWGGWGEDAPGPSVVKKCVYPDGSVIAITKASFSPSTNVNGVSFDIIDNANQGFTTIPISSVGNEIIRILTPADAMKEFIVNSDVVIDYNLLDESTKYDVKVTHTYVTQLRKDKYYVACDERVCDRAVCRGQGSCTCEDFDWRCVKTKNPTYRDWHVGCGGESKDRYSHCESSVVCDCGEDGSGCSCSCWEETWVRKRLERETFFEEREISVSNDVIIPHVSHDDILDNTRINITGVIDQFVDNRGNRGIYGTLNITLNPDILRMFILQVNDSTISYFPLVYPVKHYLYKKFASPGDTARVYTHHDSYGYERKEFDFNETCKKECPPSCWCDHPDNRFDVTCTNDTGGRFNPNTDSDPDNDCVCTQNDCYPDPCKSKRSFHEEQGVRIRNGEFERDLGEEYKNWAKINDDVNRVQNGFSGYCVKLEDGGTIKQRITPIPLHTLPYNKLCFMYGIEKCKDGGYLKLYVNGNEKFELRCDDYGSPPCDLPFGWKRQCVDIEEEYISSIKFESHKATVYIDNVNLGEYYDFVGLYTENVSSMEKYFDIGFKDYDFTGLLATLLNVRQNSTDHKTTYTFDFNTLKLSIPNTEGEMEEDTLTAKDIRENANITIHSHFRNITIDLFPSPPLTENPYVDVVIREATRIDYEFNITDPWNIKAGQEVEGTLTLHYYDPPQDAIDNEPIYITSGGKVEFLSPDSLVKDGYVMTDGNGVAKFTFKLRGSGTDLLTFLFLGHMGHSEPKASPTVTKVQVGSTESRSPFFKGDFLASFLILILILIFILFSYRFFKIKRIDIGEWFKELKGEE